MNNLSSTVKGLITGLLMIVSSTLIFKSQRSFENNLQYITYAIFVGGIIWTLVTYHRSASEKKKFKHYFSEGFKCFVVVTLLMVIFTYAFLQMNPSLKEEMAANYRSDLIKKGNYTPDEIEEMVKKAKQYFVTMLTSMTVFGYLVIGSLVTAITSAFMIQKNNPAKI